MLSQSCSTFKECEIHVLSEVPIVATPAGKPGFFLHAWRPRLFFFLCRGPGPAPCPQTPWNKCVQNQLVFFFNAWRPRLAFLYAGVQGPLLVLRLQSKPKNLKTIFAVLRCFTVVLFSRSVNTTCSRHRDFVFTLRMRLLSEPRVCVCSCTVRCAQQRDGKMHRETKRYRFFCPCTCICINVLADERALCRAPSSFWSATPPNGRLQGFDF